MNYKWSPQWIFFCKACSLNSIPLLIVKLLSNHWRRLGIFCLVRTIFKQIKALILILSVGSFIILLCRPSYQNGLWRWPHAGYQQALFHPDSSLRPLQPELADPDFGERTSSSEPSAGAPAGSHDVGAYDFRQRLWYSQSLQRWDQQSWGEKGESWFVLVIFKIWITKNLNQEKNNSKRFLSFFRC